MKKEGNRVILWIILYIGIFLPVFVLSNKIAWQLPYENGVSQVVTRGYDTVPTHVGKDRYAIDFVQSGCKSYDLPVLATKEGVAEKIAVNHNPNEKKSYGNYILINHGNNIYSRYAHLNTVYVRVGQNIRQGQILGTQGNTGSVYGTACKDHPGTHLHFVMYKKIKEKFTPFKPEPISGFSDLVSGKEYVSKNIFIDPEQVIKTKKEAKQNRSLFHLNTIIQKVKELLLPKEYASVHAQKSTTLLSIFTQKTDQTTLKKNVAEKLYHSGTFNNSNITITAKSGEAVLIETTITNNGTAQWQPNTVSLNSVGGVQAAAPFFHSSWITSLRSVQISELVLPKKSVPLSFYIQSPKEPGDHALQFQLVVQKENTFTRIDSQFLTITLSVLPTEEIKEEVVVKQQDAVVVGQVNKDIKKEIKEIVKHQIHESSKTVVQTKEQVKKVVQKIQKSIEKIIRPSWYYRNSSGSTAQPLQKKVQQPKPKRILPEITLSSPSSTMFYTNTSSTTFSGTKNEQAIEIFINSSTQDIVLTPQSWQKEVMLEEGKNQFTIFGKDVNGNETEIQHVTIFRDSLPPEILFFTAEIVNNTTPTIHLAWSGQDAGSANLLFTLGWQHNTEEWQTVLENTTSTEYITEVARFFPNNYRLKAVDEQGNTSAWVEIENGAIVLDWPKTVVINEIAWMGTGERTQDDEWIELYNTTDVDIDLQDWHIHVSGTPILWTKNNTIIPARGYYLLEKNDDNTIKQLDADGIFFMAKGLENGGEHLTLINEKQEIIDEVRAENGWFAGIANGHFRSMERINNTIPGSVPHAWGSRQGLSAKGKARSGALLFGSPAQPNVGYWLLFGLSHYYASFITASNTLYLQKKYNPFIIDYTTEIPKDMQIIAEPGVVFMGIDKSSRIKVHGSLFLQGTDEDPVMITSARDNTFPFANVSTMPGHVPEPGDWSHIFVSESGKVYASNTIFSYGGNPYLAKGGFALGGKNYAQYITNLGGEVALSYVTFENQFTHNNKRDLPYHATIWCAENGTTTIDASVFNGGYTGIRHKGSDILTIKDTTFSHFTNPDGPVVVKNTFPHISPSSVFAHNTFNGVYVGQANIITDTEITETPQYIFGNMYVAPSSTLLLLPGAQIFMRQQGDILVDGILQSKGTAQKPVTISPFNTHLRWGGIVYNTTTSTLAFTQVTSGGSGSKIGKNGGLLYAKNSTINIHNSTLSNPRKPGNIIYAKDSTITISDSDVYWTEKKPAKSWKLNGIKMDGGILSLTNTYFSLMDVGVFTRNNTTGTIHNTTPNHFTSTTQYWLPKTAFSF